MKAEIVKHGKRWKQFTCLQCGCVFKDILALNLRTGNTSVDCPECHTECHPDEEDKENG